MNAPDPAALAAAAPPEAATKAVQIADQAFTMAQAYVIDSPAMYKAAADELRDIATKARQIEETRLSITRPIDESKKRIMDLFRPPLDRLNQADSMLRTAMLDWKRAEDKRIAREREEAERVAREERERMVREQREAQEAADRARAEAEALAAAGDADAAEMAAAAAEDAAAAAAEAAEDIQLAEIAPVSMPTVAAPKAAGISGRQNWKWEGTSLAELVAAAAGVKVEDLKRTELLVYLAFNESAISGVAKALKAETRIPGVRVYPEDSLAVRRK